MFLYSLFDSCAERFLPVFESPTDRAALRMVTPTVMKSPDPGDFSLFRVGQYISEGSKFAIKNTDVLKVKDFVPSGNEGAE